MEQREDGWTKWTSNCLVPLAIFYFSPRYSIYAGLYGPFFNTYKRRGGAKRGALLIETASFAVIYVQAYISSYREKRGEIRRGGTVFLLLLITMKRLEHDGRADV